MTTPEVSVVITSWQIARLTRLCLYSVALQDFPKDKYEIIFVDDGSKDENTIMEVPSYFRVGGTPTHPTEQMRWNLENRGWTMKSAVDDVKSKFPDLDLKYYYRNKNELNWQNPAYAWNAGIKKASGDILVQLHSDNIFITEDTLFEMVNPHRSTNNLYLTTNKIALGNTILDFVDMEGVSIESISRYYNEAKKNPRGDSPNNFSWNDNSGYGDLPWVYSVRRKHVLEIGGYDEGFLGRAPIDVALMERLRTKGLIFEKVKRETASIPHIWDEGVPHRALKTKEEFLKEQTDSENIVWSKQNKLANEGKEWGVLE